MNPCLITTAIAYMNGNPHIGHVYEIILADICKNFYSMITKTELLTGSDEHGKKIETTAKNNNISPIQLCDLNCDKFKSLYNFLNVNYNRFIRTTNQDHINNVIQSIMICRNDIELSNYSGYYNVREECFVKNSEAQLTNFKDPVTGQDYEYICEETYNFLLSRYKEYIISNLNRVVGFNTDDFNSRLSKLTDLSITRVKSNDCTWGIDFPLDTNHIVYVWFDALLNYITGSNSIYGSINHNTIHIIGKDITWFHAVIYPAILKSIGLPIYNTIYVHGFILDKFGRKMSKSLGNVVDPNVILDSIPVDALRFYFFMETNYGNDIKFDEDLIKGNYNSILIDQFGNLFQRYYKLINNYIELHNIEFLVDNAIIEPILKLDIRTLRDLFISYINTGNLELSKTRPWLNNVCLECKISCLKTTGYNLFNAMNILKCIIPNKIAELNSILGMNLSSFNSEINTSFHGQYVYKSNFKAFNKI